MEEREGVKVLVQFLGVANKDAKPKYEGEVWFVSQMGLASCFSLRLLNQRLCSTHHVLLSFSIHIQNRFLIKFTTHTTFADFSQQYNERLKNNFIDGIHIFSFEGNAILTFTNEESTQNQPHILAGETELHYLILKKP